MQRLFSMFPQGRPGVGLLLLRLSVAAALLIGGGIAAALPGRIYPAAVLVAAALGVGVLTPLAATACAVAGIVALAATGAEGLYAGWIVVAVPAAIALALLGPGAYSLDALLFGRRRLALPSQRGRERR